MWLCIAAKDFTYVLMIEEQLCCLKMWGEGCGAL